MKPIAKIILTYFSNLIAIIIAVNFVPGFIISGDFKALLIVAAIFAAINLLIKPILTYILSPLIHLTIGLFQILINAGLLYLLDFLSADVTITSTQSLIYGTLIISAINFIIIFSAKSLSKTAN